MDVELLEAFMTGHPVIDEDHQRIIDGINKVSAAIQSEKYDECSQMLDDFIDTCTQHFATEEALLADLGYPHLKDHMVFHKDLTLKAKAVKVLCMDVKNPDSIQRCFDEMAALLIEDVVKGDLNFVSFLIEKGIVAPRSHVHPIQKTKLDELPSDKEL